MVIESIFIVSKFKQILDGMQTYVSQLKLVELSFYVDVEQIIFGFDWLQWLLLSMDWMDDVLSKKEQTFSKNS